MLEDETSEAQSLGGASQRPAAMGFQPPVPQEDSDWEIRVTVQLSLLLQIILIFLGPVRKRSSHPIPQFAVWSCYLLADWVADLTLGLLLNNMGNIGGGGDSTSGGGPDANSGNSPIIFAFWTPFLLLHLGGPDTITAYSLEDNELWLRHLIGLLFELFSASVIFFCSLHGNPMIPATVLVFVVGIIKYGERTYSLYSASVDGFRNKILDDPEPGPNYAKLMTELDAKEKAGLVVEIAVANGEAKNAQMEAEQEDTTRLALTGKMSMEARAYEFFLIFRRLFVNLILSFKERRLSQAFFLHRTDLRVSQAFEVIEVELNFIYDMVYTKAAVTHRRVGWALRAVCSGCLVSALAIFFFLDKGRNDMKMKPVDIGITYALLLGGVALDAAALLMLLFSNRVKVAVERSRRFKWLERLIRTAWQWHPPHWSGKTSQLNLIGYCLDKPADDSPWRLKIADKLGIEEIIDDLLSIRRVPLSKHDIREGDRDEGENSLLRFIFDGLKKAATAPEMKEKEKIMEFCNCRGERALNRKRDEIAKALGNDDKGHAVIMDSVKKRDFDESLLMWHIATDLCLLSDEDQRLGPVTEDNKWRRLVGGTLSEYMLYLLIKQPDMLQATAGIGLLRYRDTCAEAQRFFGPVAAESWMTSEEGRRSEVHNSARKMLLSVNTSRKPVLVKGDRSKSVLFDACILAKELMKLDGEGFQWEVVTEVWGEMLTYAAGKCPGSSHMRQLSRGGELITLVGFLMAHMGLGDMYQIHEGDAKAKLIVVDQ
ncbi:hypothetical protein ACP70R_015066 [Stipagrostis hirtigluma subsp. patula]